MGINVCQIMYCITINHILFIISCVLMWIVQAFKIHKKGILIWYSVHLEIISFKLLLKKTCYFWIWMWLCGLWLAFWTATIWFTEQNEQIKDINVFVQMSLIQKLPRFLKNSIEGVFYNNTLCELSLMIFFLNISEHIAEQALHKL